MTFMTGVLQVVLSDAEANGVESIEMYISHYNSYPSQFWVAEFTARNGDKVKYEWSADRGPGNLKDAAPKLIKSVTKTEEIL